jgi:hypothetical protein
MNLQLKCYWRVWEIAKVEAAPAMDGSCLVANGFGSSCQALAAPALAGNKKHYFASVLLGINGLRLISSGGLVWRCLSVDGSSWADEGPFLDSVCM